jgi:hypothetical protein
LLGIYLAYVGSIEIPINKRSQFLLPINDWDRDPENLCRGPSISTGPVLSLENTMSFCKKYGVELIYLLRCSS